MKIYKKIAVVVLLATSLTACTSNFEEANTNPNKITVNSGILKCTSMYEPILYGGSKALTYYSWFWNDELVQFTAFTGGTTRQEHRYFIGDSNWQSVWNTFASYANNDVNMYNLAVKQNYTAIQAVALTLKVLFMSNLTDMYGDIPYSEAFKIDNGIDKPAFDSQESVYKQMCLELEKANEIYATSPYVDPDDTSRDGMYQFDMAKWRKFNNSLYLRLLCRISGRTSTLIDETNTVARKMQQIVSNPTTYPVFSSNADNATVKFSGVAPYYSQFDPGVYTENTFTAGGYKLTEQLIKMTVIRNATGQATYEDPRLKIFGKKAVSYTDWKGTIAGCDVGEQTIADKGASYLNYEVFCRATADEWFMDYAEVKFILAEAALKGYIIGGETAAKTYYEAAVAASMEKWSAMGTYSKTPCSITPDEVTAFLNSSLGSWDSALDKEDKEVLIANQKYLALFMTGMEPYHEYTRTGYPVLTIGKGCVYNNFILPTRFAYPNTTMATNSNNAKAALTRMGGDNDMKTPVWWSKQAIDAGK
jgi:hypothetical protein